MGFKERVASYLGLPSQKTLEQLNETLKTQEQLLANAEDAKDAKTFVSSLARETRKIEDFEGLVKKRNSVKDLQLLYLNNQFIFRGVNVRADELITRGYKLLGGSDEGIKVCQELIDNSGGENLFWQLSVNTDVAGDGYFEKVTNQAKTRIALLKHINPINFGFWTERDNMDKIVIASDGQPEAYMQVIIDNEGKEQRIKVPREKITHLRFNTFGDEFNGISSLQPVYNTTIRLMNMEHAAAEAAVKTANPTWVVMTETKSPHELAKWMNVMGKVSAKEVVFTPAGVTTKLESPGNQNFNNYADYFLNAVVAALGVPKSILTGSSEAGSGSRATAQTLSKHFFSVIRSNQRYVETLFNKIFEEYGEMASFEPPQLVFNDIAEDADRNGQRAVELYGANLITLEEARDLIGLETSKMVKDELKESQNAQSKGNIDPDKEAKRQDMETWHPDAPGSPGGSQKNEKKGKKFNSDVPSVR